MIFPKIIKSKIELLKLIESWKLSCSSLNKIVGLQFSFSIEDFKVPVFNEKDFSNVVDELLRDLQKSNCTSNSGSMNITYNSQWRHFGAKKNGDNGVDQIKELIKILKTKNCDRRLLVVAWNPNSATKGPVLTHCLLQFYVTEGGLSCKLYQSSGNLENVLRYDSARAVILTYMLCQVTGLRPARFIHTFGDIDFDPNVPWRDEMEMEREFPTLRLREGHKEIEDFVFDDFNIELGQKFEAEFISHCQFTSESEAGNHEELQYLQLVRNIIEHGTRLMDRTKVGTMSIFGQQMVFSLQGDTLPLLTTKRVFARGIIEELLWFLRGSTSGNELAEKDVHIWDANGSPEYLDSIGLGYREAGDLGPVYGFQWRHFGATYDTMHADYSNQGVDQIANLIRSIKEDPDNKNHVLLAWNPKDLPLMALPPCHCLSQFFVEDGELSCKLYQRSGDMGLGVPFNIASYAIFTRMVAHVTGLKPGRFFHTLGDSHVYLNHVEAMQIQLTRKPREFPKLTFKRQVDRIEDFHVDDFIIENYHPHPKIHMEMAL